MIPSSKRSSWRRIWVVCSSRCIYIPVHDIWHKHCMVRGWTIISTERTFCIFREKEQCLALTDMYTNRLEVTDRESASRTERLIKIKKHIGVMQDYYQQKVFGNNYPNIVVLLSFTGTICLICTNCCTSLGQILASYVGVTWAVTIGSLLMTSGLIFASFSTEVCNGQVLPHSFNQLHWKRRETRSGTCI